MIPQIYPEGRAHHPVLPGFWLHRTLGIHEVAPDGQHSAFFLQHPELFGTDLQQAYADGWVSTRRWIGSPPVWAVAFGRYLDVRETLATWAIETIQRWPEEAAVLLHCVSLFDPQNPAALDNTVCPAAEQAWTLRMLSDLARS